MKDYLILMLLILIKIKINQAMKRKRRKSILIKNKNQMNMNHKVRVVQKILSNYLQNNNSYKIIRKKQLNLNKCSLTRMLECLIQLGRKNCLKFFMILDIERFHRTTEKLSMKTMSKTKTSKNKEGLFGKNISISNRILYQFQINSCMKERSQLTLKLHKCISLWLKDRSTNLMINCIKKIRNSCIQNL